MNRQTSSFFSFVVEKLQNVKKTDWIALALAGAILLILAMPSSDIEDVVGSGQSIGEKKGSAELLQVQEKMQEENTSEYRAEEYVKELETRLEAVLVQMEGVGAVKVMITISDYGETIVEKDVLERSNSVTEIESGNITNTSIEQEMKEETIRVESENGTWPYIEKEILPSIEGVVVVAQGGGNPTVVSNISKATMALFPIEAHKIIVVKMSDKGDMP